MRYRKVPFLNDFSNSVIQEWGRSEIALSGVYEDVPTILFPLFTLGDMNFRFEGMHTRCLRKCVNKDVKILNDIRETNLPNPWELVSNRTNLKKIDEDKWFLKMRRDEILLRFWNDEKWRVFLGKGKS